MNEGMGDQPFVTVQTDGFRHALWRRVSLLIVRGYVAPEDIEAMRLGLRRYVAEQPGKLLTLSILSPFKARLDGEVRQRMKELFDEFEHLHVAEAHVVPAAGFIGAMQLSLITALFAIRGNPVPYKTFKSIEEAASWLTEFMRELDPNCSPLALARVARTLSFGDGTAVEAHAATSP